MACCRFGAKKGQYYVMVCKCPDIFVLTVRQNEGMCCTRRGDGEDVGFGVFFPSDLIQRTNWDALKHKTDWRSIVSSVCQSSRRDMGDLITG